MGSESNSDNTTQSVIPHTIVADLDAPRLEGISTTHFSNFHRKREISERKIKERNKEPNTNRPLISYKASIERSFLQMMITARWITAETEENITEEELVEEVNTRSRRVFDETQIRNVELAVRNVKTNSKVLEAEDRVWNLYADYTEALEDSRLLHIPNTHPHIAIRHVSDRIQRISLKDRMKDIARIRKKEKFEEKDF